VIHHQDDWLTVHGGDVREVLPTLASDSVDCIVSSPPYWGLRDYGSDGQLGLEATPEQYVANLVGVFRELRRVLKPSGTCWLNLGDSYNSIGHKKSSSGYGTTGLAGGIAQSHTTLHRENTDPDLKHKDLVGIPWRVAFALQADGWWLRSDIIWSKPNPMPESVTDRPTKAHEYLFLLTKSARYYYDADAVAEPLQDSSISRLSQATIGEQTGSFRQPGKTNGAMKAVMREPRGKALTSPRHDGNGWNENNGRRFILESATRNLRSVWTIATRPYAGAHFAVFPPELPERCIKAGSPEGGVVLDPFAGSGTVGLVANRLSRRAILIDLNPAYLEQQMRRNAQTPLGLGA
jgi:DNA modification methylase